MNDMIKNTDITDLAYDCGYCRGRAIQLIDVNKYLAAVLKDVQGDIPRAAIQDFVTANIMLIDKWDAVADDAILVAEKEFGYGAINE